jgi:transketolase
VPETVPVRATREAYRDRLVALMPAHERVLCLDTDTGLFSGADFGAAADRYVNIGIAEHTLMGMAAGLAASGWMPFVNTMAAFASARALEAVKLDIAYNNLPVRIMATHGGLSAGHFGPTHQALEDLAVMRALPNMTVVVPADAMAAEAVVTQTLHQPGPVYVRLGRKPTPAVPAPVPVIGTIQHLRAGHDVVITCCGPHPVLASLRAADALVEDGVEAAVLNVHTLKPLDGQALLDAAAGVRLVVTVEEHWGAGGLGAAVAETLSAQAPTRVLRIGMPDEFASVVGDHDFLLEHYGITADAIVSQVRQALGLAATVPEGTDAGWPTAIRHPIHAARVGRAML